MKQTIKIILTLFLIFMDNLVMAQRLYKVTIYNTSKDIAKGGYTIDSVKKMQFDLLEDGSIYIKTLSNKNHFYSLDSIWGYKIGRTIYRCKYGWGKIEAIDDMIIYHEGYGIKQHWTFSKNLNSRIYTFTPYHLNKVYKNDTAFLNALNKDFAWTEPYITRNPKTGQFKILETYKQTHAKK